MWIRGAPLIGAVGAYGLALALDRDAVRRRRSPRRTRRSTRRGRPPSTCAGRSTACAQRLRRLRRPRAPTPRGTRRTRSPPRTSRSTTRSASTASRCCAAIAQRRPGPVRVMTHCNAGALATCGWGTATAPLFLAHAEGLPLHVWVSETRPRMQGASLTAWELDQRGIPHTLVRGQRERAPDAARRRRRGVRRRRPRRAQRRRVQQDRHLRQGARRARQQRAVLRRAAVADDRLERLPPARRIPIEMRDARRGADGRRPRRLRPDRARRDRAARHQGGQLRVRRHARAAGQRARHRARHHARLDASGWPRCFRSARA